MSLIYFPYLQGRQFELLAIRELVENNLITENVVPILEPISMSSTFLKTLTVCAEKNHSIAVIKNPEYGSFLSQMKSSADAKKPEECMSAACVIPAYLADGSSEFKSIVNGNDNHVMLINRKHDDINYYPSPFQLQPDYVTVTFDRKMMTKFSKSNGNVIYLQDNFKQAKRNADYALNDDEFFSDDYEFAKSAGYLGFSDYTIVGSAFTETGFAPNAVAIHIVYFDSGELKIHHFVSDSNEDVSNPAKKFAEAVEKLRQWFGNHPSSHTKGLQTLLDFQSNGRYPGLGTVKKLSIMHHLELMSRFLETY